MRGASAPLLAARALASAAQALGSAAQALGSAAQALGSNTRVLASSFQLMFAVAVALVLSGCGGPDSQRVTLRFWAMGQEGETVARIIPAFEREHPDIHVEIQQIPWSAAHEKLLTAFAGDALPDLCQLGNTWVAEFAALRALEALDARVAATPSVDPHDYFTGIWQTGVVEGRLLAVPWYVDTRVLFYRKDILAAAGVAHPPQSWREWRDALAAVKRHVGTDRFSILLPLNEPEPLLALALQSDTPLLRDDGRYGGFSGAGFRQALRFYADMFEHGWAPAASAADISNVWNEFGRGYFTFYISGPWNIAEFRQRLPAARQNDWMTAPLPGPTGPGVSTAGGASLVIFRSSRHRDAAWALIEYLSRSPVQAQLYALSGDLPPRRSAWEDPALAHDIYAHAFREQLERVRPAPAVPEWERILGLMQDSAERVVRAHVSIEDATTALDREVDAVLEKRRWLLERGAQ